MGRKPPRPTPDRRKPKAKKATGSYPDYSLEKDEYETLRKGRKDTSTAYKGPPDA